MTIEEGSKNVEASQDTRPTSRKPRRKVKPTREVEEPLCEVQEGEAGPSEMPPPKVRTRAQPKCSGCGSLEHNSRKCPGI